MGTIIAIGNAINTTSNRGSDVISLQDNNGGKLLDQQGGGLEPN